MAFGCRGVERWGVGIIDSELESFDDDAFRSRIDGESCVCGLCALPDHRQYFKSVSLGHHDGDPQLWNTLQISVQRFLSTFSMYMDSWQTTCII
jgi:hypothetical protein